MSEVSTTHAPDTAGTQPERVGHVFRGFRQAAALSLREMAEMLGVSPSWLGRVERDEVYTTREERWQLAKFCGELPSKIGSPWARVNRPVWGDGVRALRGIHRMSRETLAAEAGVTTDLIARIECGDHRSLSVAAGARLADALGVSADLLFPDEVKA